MIRLEKFFGYFRGLLDVVQELQSLRRDVSALQEAERQRQINDTIIIARIREIAQEFVHLKENQKLEREKLTRDLEIELLKMERRLPPRSE